jgi:hypothetical protein
LAELIEVYAAPVIKQELRRRLGLFAGEDPDADELFGDAVVRLVERLSAQGRDPLDDFRGYTARVAAHICHDFLRDRYPKRARLKKRLRALLRRHPDFDAWARPPAEILCGFSAGEGQPGLRPSDWPGDLTERIRSKFPRGADLKGLPLARIVAGVFGELGRAIELDDLVGLVAELQGVRDRPVESVEEPGLHESIVSRRPAEDEAIVARERLRLAWAEVRRLQYGHRLAVCLTVDDGETADLPSLLVEGGICTFPEVAEGLGLSLVDFFALYHVQPACAAVAGHLGLSPAQVNRMRWRGRRKLRVRFGLE